MWKIYRTVEARYEQSYIDWLERFKQGIYPDRKEGKGCTTNIQNAVGQ